MFTRRACRQLALPVMQAMTIVSVAIAILVTRADPDLWGHLKFGAEILQDHRLPAVDSYSFTSDRLWVNHEWLSEVAFAAAYSFGGLFGLIAFKALLIIAAAGCVVGIAWQEGARGRPIMIMGVLAVAGILTRAGDIRPQLMSILCFAILLNRLRRADCGQTRALWVIPPLFTLWANAHGGWLVGCATLWGWSLGRLWQLRREPLRGWFAPVAVSIAATIATLATPYGVILWSFLRETVGPSRALIGEWGPITGVPVLIVPWLLSWLLLLLALRRTRMPFNRAEALIPLALGIASAQVSRLDVFFALSVLGFLSEPITRILARPRGENVRSQPISRPWRFGAALLGTCVPLALAWRSLTCIQIDEPSMPEPDAIRTIQGIGLQGRMLTFYDWGEYALWYFPPGLRISMDGRRETVYSQQTVANHLDLYLGTDTGIAYLRQLNPDYVWLPNLSPVVPILVRNGWTTVYGGSLSTILARQPIPVSSVDQKPWARTTRSSLRRCFPGP